MVKDTNKNKYYEAVGRRKTATAIEIHIICFSKYALSAEKPCIVPNPRRDMARAEAKRYQSI